MRGGEPALTSGIAAVWFIWIKPMEIEGVSSDTLSPPLAQKAQTQRLLAMQRDYTGRVDFGIPTDSLRRQIPDLPNFLTLAPYLGEVA